MTERLRMDREEYFMEVARLGSDRSTCLHTWVSAVLVREGKIIATGFNGAPAGFPHCSTCLRETLKVPQGEKTEICRGSHAEANCLAQCARFGISAEGSIMYVTHRPCSMCLKLLINAGVKEIVYEKEYHDDLVDQMLLVPNRIKIKKYFKGGSSSGGTC